MPEVIFGAIGFATLFVLFVVLPSRIQRRSTEERNRNGKEIELLPKLLLHHAHGDQEALRAFREGFGAKNVGCQPAKDKFLSLINSDNPPPVIVVADPYYSVVGYGSLLTRIFGKAPAGKVIVFLTGKYRTELEALFSTQVQSGRLFIVGEERGLAGLLTTTAELLQNGG